MDRKSLTADRKWSISDRLQGHDLSGTAAVPHELE
jgi:hypothetical protein